MDKKELRDLVYCGKFVGILSSLAYITRGNEGSENNWRQMEELLRVLGDTYDGVRDGSIAKMSIDFYIIRNGGFDTFKQFQKKMLILIEQKDIQKIQKLIQHIWGYIDRDMIGSCFWEYLDPYYIENLKKETLERAKFDLQELIIENNED